MKILAEIQEVIEALARTHGPAVVGLGRRSGRGSGIVVAPGEVLTLASNLSESAQEVEVILAGTLATGTVAGLDGVLDLALITVPTGEIEPLGWAPAPAGLGEAVIALANPGGQGLRATLGFVAAVERSYRGPRGRVIGGALEHTAVLPRGAGGGPLLDVEGRVLGVNAVRVHGGLILAMPGSAVHERARHLRAPRPGQPTQLGVAIVSPVVARRLRRAVGLPERDGLLVQGVVDGSPAERARICEGDLIVAAARVPVANVDALYAALDRVPGDGSIELRIVRGVEEHDVVVGLDGGG